MKLIKVAAVFAALGVLGVLFVRSAQSSRTEPYTVARDRLAGWTLALETEAVTARSGSVLTLRPNADLASRLGTQIFRRAGESLNYPNPAGMSLVLRSELDRAAPGALTPEALLGTARAAGLETAAFEPRCMGHRRVSEPGVTRGVYFVVFDSPAFVAFRQQVATQVRAAGGGASLFDPAAMSPVLIVAGLDGGFSRWLPIKVDPQTDCVAPVTVE